MKIRCDMKAFKGNIRLWSHQGQTEEWGCGVGFEEDDLA